MVIPKLRFDYRFFFALFIDKMQLSTRWDKTQMRLTFWGLRVLFWLGRAPDMTVLVQIVE